MYKYNQKSLLDKLQNKNKRDLVIAIVGLSVVIAYLLIVSQFYSCVNVC